jgi:hypothetical protein
MYFSSLCKVSNRDNCWLRLLGGWGDQQGNGGSRKEDSRNSESGTKQLLLLWSSFQLLSFFIRLRD